MRIDANSIIEDKRVYNRTNEIEKNNNKGKNKESQQTESDRDKVSLSGKAKEINDLKAIINDLPDIRRDRIDSVKNAIDTGSYNFDSLKIAQKFLEEEM